MVPMRSIFFALIVAPFKTWFLHHETLSNVQNLIFDDTDTNLLSVCVHLLLIVQMNLKLYFAVSYFGDFFYFTNNSAISVFTVTLFLSMETFSSACNFCKQFRPRSSVT